MKVNLSVVIITFNEEAHIERCLKSVIDIADEIVVLDSFSTDGTKEICDRYPVTFLEHSFEGYIEQKNLAITHATYPHILSLDADEALNENLVHSIQKVKNAWEKDGYEMNRLTNYCGTWIRHCGWYPDTKLRLVDSRKGRWKGINPHDKYMMDSGASVARLKGDILHYSYDSISQHINQTNKFTDISAAEYLEKGKKGSIFKITLNPFFAFIRSYILKRGFMDGYYGFVISVLAAQSTFLKYIKTRQLFKNTPIKKS